jgi:hypothetical protein
VLFGQSEEKVVTRFFSPEEAALFAASRRDEGYLSLALSSLTRAWRRAMAGEPLPLRTLLLFFGAVLGSLLAVLIIFF